MDTEPRRGEPLVWDVTTRYGHGDPAPEGNRRQRRKQAAEMRRAKRKATTGTGSPGLDAAIALAATATRPAMAGRLSVKREAGYGDPIATAYAS